MGTFLLPALFLVLSATGQPPPGGPAGPKATVTPVPVRTIVGRIDSVDMVKGEVVISETASRTTPAKHKGETVLLHVDPETAVTRGKTPAALETLLPGDQTVARYLAGPGAFRALSIRAASPVRTPAPTPSPAAPVRR